MLSDPRLDELVRLIRDSFRVQPNREPVYVEIADHLQRVASPQHQIIFGRRGSGKSCLLVHFHRSQNPEIHSIYINADEHKRLSYPDLLIRLVLAVLEALPQEHRRFFRRKPTAAGRMVTELRSLLDEASEQSISRRIASVDVAEDGAEADWKLIRASASDRFEQTHDLTSAYREQKLDRLERHLADYKAALREAIDSMPYSHLAIIVDDFYAVPPAVQPDVIDYLHRLCRGTSAYLKIGTIRHRTRLVRFDDGQTIGVEANQDVEPIDLDQTFENVERTHAYLRQMLDSMGREVDVPDASDVFLSPDGLFQLTLASGGVPRDYLNIFTEAVDAARAGSATRWITPIHVNKGAARESYRTKLRNFREDAGGDVAPLERLFQDLMFFCLKEKRRTAFLIEQGDAQSDPEGHELVRQLMDFKLIHVIEADTSAASGRPGRYEAYTLDFSSFMEPRRRGIEIVEFWKTDENRRPRGLREAPVYSLARGRAAANNPVEADADLAAESLDEELGLEPDEEELSDGD